MYKEPWGSGSGNKNPNQEQKKIKSDLLKLQKKHDQLLQETRSKSKNAKYDNLKIKYDLSRKQINELENASVYLSKEIKELKGELIKFGSNNSSMKIENSPQQEND